MLYLYFHFLIAHLKLNILSKTPFHALEISIRITEANERFSVKIGCLYADNFHFKSYEYIEIESFNSKLFDVYCDNLINKINNGYTAS